MMSEHVVNHARQEAEVANKAEVKSVVARQIGAIPAAMFDTIYGPVGNLGHRRDVRFAGFLLLVTSK